MTNFTINHYPSRSKPDPIRPYYEQLKYLEPESYDKASRYANKLCIRSSHKVHPNKFNPQAFEQSRAKKYHATIYRQAIGDSSDDQFFEVSNVQVNRLDIISSKFYQTPIFWWAIAQANKEIMFDPMNIPLGTVLRIPSIQTLYEPGGVLDGRI